MCPDIIIRDTSDTECNDNTPENIQKIVKTYLDNPKVKS